MMIAREERQAARQYSVVGQTVSPLEISRVDDLESKGGLKGLRGIRPYVVCVCVDGWVCVCMCVCEQ